jgi:micrococcal nuclease
MFYNTFMKKLLPVLFTLLFSVALAQLEPRGQLQGMFEVARVVDGDTVRVVINGQEEAIRLIGIDTPETVHPTRGEEPFGREASDFTKGLLEGRSVYLEFDVEERDRFGRLLAYLYIDDANGAWQYTGAMLTQVNYALAIQGYASQATFPPNVRYVDLYESAVREARNAGRGLHGAAPQQATQQAQPAAQAANLRYDPFGPDRDCGDFSTQREAQAFFEAAGGPATDRHRLDRDRDGVVCESLR